MDFAFQWTPFAKTSAQVEPAQVAIKDIILVEPSASFQGKLIHSVRNTTLVEYAPLAMLDISIAEAESSASL